jgi:hypothetical protein
MKIRNSKTQPSGNIGAAAVRFSVQVGPGVATALPINIYISQPEPLDNACACCRRGGRSQALRETT